MAKLVADEETRLKVNSPEFLQQHEEIMALCERVRREDVDTDKIKYK